jgi:hypothetical protein
MVSFSTWRAFYRIPLVRKNKEAIGILRDMFYVLIALHREYKLQEFSQLRYLYFKMIDSFAQYGRVEAKDTVDQILKVPWFRDDRRNLYRLLSSYNNVIRNIASNGNRFPSKSTQEQLNKDMDNFFQAYKSLIRFDEMDEKRISKLLENRKLLDEIVNNFQLDPWR